MSLVSKRNRHNRQIRRVEDDGVVEGICERCGRVFGGVWYVLESYWYKSVVLGGQNRQRGTDRWFCSRLCAILQRVDDLDKAMGRPPCEARELTDAELNQRYRQYREYARGLGHPQTTRQVEAAIPPQAAFLEEPEGD